MFDTKHYHEHRAPTDDSVRLLQDMREKAFESIIAEQRCKNNIFDYNVFIRKKEPSIFNDYELIMQAEINGKTYISTCEIESQEVKEKLLGRFIDYDFNVLVCEKK